MPDRFREKQVTTPAPTYSTYSIRKPEDEAVPMYAFRFNYAPEAVLQAQGRIPSKSLDPGYLAYIFGSDF